MPSNEQSAVLPRLPNATDRRFSTRVQSEIPMHVGDGILVSAARSVDVSAGGVLIARSCPTRSTDDRVYLEVEMAIPGEDESVTALARPVWSLGPYQALKFIRMSDVDRLTLAELVDRVTRSAA